MLIAYLVLAIMDEEMPFPSEAVRQPGERRARSCDTFTQEQHGWLSGDGDLDDPFSTTGVSMTAEHEGGSSGTDMMRLRAEKAEPMRDKRGRHEDRSHRVGYAQVAYEHLQQAEAFNLGRPCLHSCPFDRKCGMNFTPAHLMRAHEKMYGTNTTKINRDGQPPLYKCALTFSEVKERRTQLVLSSISCDAADTSRRVERFMVSGIGPVCAEYCRSAHGIPFGAWISLLADARAGRLQAGVEWDAAGEEMDYADLHDAGEGAVAKEETIQWWVLWLFLEDQMPNESVITHRVVVWEGVHKLEYSADMEWFGTTAPLSRSRWTTLRQDALAELSAEWYGVGDDGKPLAMLTLCGRAKHSNFGSCHQCAQDKKAWIEFRTRKRGDGAGATAIDARAFKERLFTHIREVKLQRTGMMRLAQECASHAGWLFGYDDACGSNFLYWPTEVREDGKHGCDRATSIVLRCSATSILALYYVAA